MDDPTKSDESTTAPDAEADDLQNDRMMTLFVVCTMAMLLVMIAVILIADRRPPAGL